MADDKDRNQPADQRSPAQKARDQASGERGRVQAKARDGESVTELPDGGVVLEPAADAVADNSQADTDFAARVVRSQEQVIAKGDADPREVVDKDHVEVAGGDLTAADPTVPAPGTLLPKNSSEVPQGTQPGAHVPAAKRVSASGQPLN